MPMCFRLPVNAERVGSECPPYLAIHYMVKFDKAGKMTHVTDFKFK